MNFIPVNTEQTHILLYEPYSQYTQHAFCYINFIPTIYNRHAFHTKFIHVTHNQHILCYMNFVPVIHNKHFYELYTHYTQEIYMYYVNFIFIMHNEHLQHLTFLSFQVFKSYIPTIM